MNKILKIAAAILCVAGLTLSFSACGNNEHKPDNPDNGDQTETPIIPIKTEYSVINNGEIDAAVLTGTADKGEGEYMLKNAVLELNKAVILPFVEDAEWKISFKGTLMPNGEGGGQILNSLYDDTNGRVYLGTNGPNNVMFMGVCVGDTYANYCWDVSLSTMRDKHEYEIEYADGQFTLHIDNSSSKKFECVNVNQANRTEADGIKASRELVEKICAVTGQKYVKLTHVGSNTHKCTNELSELKIETSSVKGYKKNYYHPLSDKIIYYLGSSVTRGHGGNTDGTSFAEMTANLTGGTFKKEAISGTNLAITGGRKDSYVERLSKLKLADNLPDVLVVQLSTNDFYNSIPLGAVAEEKNVEVFDKTTLTGAIEYIIAETTALSPETKVVLYTCPLGANWSKYNEYGTYVDGTLKELEQKWTKKLYVLDLYNADYLKVPSYIQGDNLHPQKEGYAQVFTPYFINLLNKIL